MDAGNVVGVLLPEARAQTSPPVAALGAVTRVAESRHEHLPRGAYPLHAPAHIGRLVAEAVAGQRRTDHVKGITCAAAVRRRVRERADDLQELDDRAGPAVRHDEG